MRAEFMVNLLDDGRYVAKACFPGFKNISGGGLCLFSAISNLCLKIRSKNLAESAEIRKFVKDLINEKV